MHERRPDEDDALRRAWLKALDACEAPTFEQHWARARAQARGRRGRRGLAVVLAVAAALILGVLVFGPRERGGVAPAIVLADASLGAQDAVVLHARLSFDSLSLRGPTDVFLGGTELPTESFVVPSALLDVRALLRVRVEGGRP